MNVEAYFKLPILGLVKCAKKGYGPCVFANTVRLVSVH